MTQPDDKTLLSIADFVFFLYVPTQKQKWVTYKWQI